MRTHLVALLALLEATGGPAQASVVGSIRRAVDHARVTRTAGRTRLYGVTVDGPDTAHGRLACARVVAVILHHAGVTISSRLLSVRSVEKALASLRSWQTVTHEDQVKAGDVIIYRAGWNPSGNCTGGGTCHVVIATSDYRVYGNIPYDIPPFFKKGPTTHSRLWSRLTGFRFKVGYRPPGK